MCYWRFLHTKYKGYTTIIFLLVHLFITESVSKTLSSNIFILRKFSEQTINVVAQWWTAVSIMHSIEHNNSFHNSEGLNIQQRGIVTEVNYYILISLSLLLSFSCATCIDASWPGLSNGQSAPGPLRASISIICLNFRKPFPNPS
jgi:hypothetical protein